MLAQKLLSGGVETLYVDDCFACHTYTGTNAPQALVTGQDLLAHGGVAHFKSRGDAHVHVLVHSARGLDKTLGTDSPSGQGTSPAGTDVTSFNSNGLSLGTGNNFSVNVDASIVAWVLRNAPNFYGHQVVVKSSGSNATVSFPEHTAGLGMVRVKRTDSTGSWYVWHRSLSAGQLLIGETTAAAATLGHITVSGTTVTLVNAVIADGTYLVEAFAHDTSTDGIIQCGSFTTDGSGNATVNHGWSAGVQFAKIKSTSTSGDWEMFDTARTSGWSGSDARLRANLSSAEDSVTRLSASGTSVSFSGLSVSATYVYVFIVAAT